jgi:hypothetical protein
MDFHFWTLLTGNRPMWYTWQGIHNAEENIPTAPPSGDATAYSTTSTDYVPTILDLIALSNRETFDISTMENDKIELMWHAFVHNVHPFVKIFFAWEIEPLVRKSQRDSHTMPGNERALITGIMFMGATSLLGDDCVSTPHEEKGLFVHQLQRALETELLTIRYATTRNTVILQAFMLYIVSLR